MKIRSPSPRVGAAAGYLLCLALVPVYVNMFPIWKYLSSRFGDPIFIFLPAAILFLFFGLSLLVHYKFGKAAPSIHKTSVTLGILLCCLGLLSTDPEFPVKRIHVAEYAFLCLVARYAMSHFVHGSALFFFSAGFSTILGVHDEFLQGFHPARTYGLRDMAVNLLGSFGGGLIWHGLHLFSPNRGSSCGRVDAFFLCWLSVSVLLLVWPVVFYRGLVVEIWVTLPLLAAPVYYFFFQERFTGEHIHGITVLGAAAVVLAAYPLLTRVPGIIFY